LADSISSSHWTAFVTVLNFYLPVNKIQREKTTWQTQFLLLIGQPLMVSPCPIYMYLTWAWT